MTISLILFLALKKYGPGHGLTKMAKIIGLLSINLLNFILNFILNIILYSTQVTN